MEILGRPDEYEVRVADILNLIIPHLREDDFVLKKKYKIVKSVTSTYGKWPITYGNAFFLDSRYLVDDIVDMIH